MTDQAKKESNAQRETDAELKLKLKSQPPPKSERSGPACADVSKCEKKGGGGFPAERRARQGKMAGERKKRFAGARLASRHCPAPCRAMVASGPWRSACRLAGGASGGGVVKCALLRSNGENLALGSGLFLGLRRKDPDADSRPASSGSAHFAKPSPKRRARLWPDRRGRLPSFAPPSISVAAKNSEERS